MPLAIDCPLCAGATQRLFSKDSYWIRECGGCGHRHAELEESRDHVDRTYGDSYFSGGGAGYRDYLSEGEILRAHGERYARLLGRYLPPGKLLDVGCAAGFLLKGMIDGGWEGDGLEPNARMAGFAKSELGLNVFHCSLEEYQGEAGFDLVSMIQVLPHFVDPAAALARVKSLVRPGGHLLIETWNHRSRTARLFGKHWHEYSPPSVLHWFSPDELAAFLERFGFTKVASGRPAKWLNMGHAKSLVTYKLQHSRLGRAASVVLGLVPARLSVPYPAEDLFWMLLEQTG